MTSYTYGSVTKRFTFSAAHILPKHAGKCKSLHGHNYEVHVSVSGPIDLETGMVIDFGDLKLAVKPYIDAMDHSFIYGHEGPLDLVELLKVRHSKVFPLLGFEQSTAENIANYLAENILADIEELFSEDQSVSLEVTVFETDDSQACVLLHRELSL